MVDVVGFWLSLSILVLPPVLLPVYFLLANLEEKIILNMRSQGLVRYRCDAERRLPKIFKYVRKLGESVDQSVTVWSVVFFPSVVALSGVCVSAFYLLTEGAENFHNVVDTYIFIAEFLSPLVGWSAIAVVIVAAVLNANTLLASACVSYLRLMNKVK